MQSLRRKAKRNKKFADEFDKSDSFQAAVDNVTTPLRVGFTKSGRKVLYRQHDSMVRENSTSCNTNNGNLI